MSKSPDRSLLEHVKLIVQPPAERLAVPLQGRMSLQIEASLLGATSKSVFHLKELVERVLRSIHLNEDREVRCLADSYRENLGVVQVEPLPQSPGRSREARPDLLQVSP